MDRLSYDILTVIFSYLDILSLALFKITNKEHYHLLQNEERLINYEIRIRDLLASGIDLKFHNSYYMKDLIYIRNLGFEICEFNLRLVQLCMYFNNFDFYNYYLKKISLTKQNFEALLEYAINKNLLNFLRYFLQNKEKIQKDYIEYIDIDSDDEDLLYNPRKYDIINEETITTSILDEILHNNRKEVILLLKEYNSLSKYSFLTRLIELDKLELFEWFIKEICKFNENNKKHFPFSIISDCVDKEKYDFLQKCKELHLTSFISCGHINDFIQRAIWRRDDRLKETLLSIFEDELNNK